jgi:hypothetical protein
MMRNLHFLFPALKHRARLKEKFETFPNMAKFRLGLPIYSSNAHPDRPLFEFSAAALAPRPKHVLIHSSNAHPDRPRFEFSAVALAPRPKHLPTYSSNAHPDRPLFESSAAALAPRLRHLHEATL